MAAAAQAAAAQQRLNLEFISVFSSLWRADQWGPGYPLPLHAWRRRVFNPRCDRLNCTPTQRVELLPLTFESSVQSVLNSLLSERAEQIRAWRALPVNERVGEEPAPYTEDELFAFVSRNYGSSNPVVECENFLNSLEWADHDTPFSYTQRFKEAYADLKFAQEAAGLPVADISHYLQAYRQGVPEHMREKLLAKSENCHTLEEVYTLIQKYYDRMRSQNHRKRMTRENFEREITRALMSGELDHTNAKIRAYFRGVSESRAAQHSWTPDTNMAQLLGKQSFSTGPVSGSAAMGVHRCGRGDNQFLSSKNLPTQEIHTSTSKNVRCWGPPLQAIDSGEFRARGAADASQPGATPAIRFLGQMMPDRAIPVNEADRHANSDPPASSTSSQRSAGSSASASGSRPSANRSSSSTSSNLARPASGPRRTLRKRRNSELIEESEEEDPDEGRGDASPPPDSGSRRTRNSGRRGNANAAIESPALSSDLVSVSPDDYRQTLDKKLSQLSRLQHLKSIREVDARIQQLLADSSNPAGGSSVASSISASAVSAPAPVQPLGSQPPVHAGTGRNSSFQHSAINAPTICYGCGGTGHFARDCPHGPCRQRGRPCSTACPHYNRQGSSTSANRTPGARSWACRNHRTNSHHWACCPDRTDGRGRPHVPYSPWENCTRCPVSTNHRGGECRTWRYCEVCPEPSDHTLAHNSQDCPVPCRQCPAGTTTANLYSCPVHSRIRGQAASAAPAVNQPVHPSRQHLVRPGTGGQPPASQGSSSSSSTAPIS